MKEKFQDHILFKRKEENQDLIREPCIFLDRDGVIIEDLHYISDPKDVKLCQGAKELIRYFHNKKNKIIIVTNQSGIKRNHLSWQDYKNVTKKMINLLGQPNPITAIYANSFTDIENGTWRKPNPGMLFQAAEDYRIDLKNSLLIGDRKTDLDAGINAGLTNLVHVLTGHGKYQREEILSSIDEEKNYIFSNKKAKLNLVPNLNWYLQKVLK